VSKVHCGNANRFGQALLGLLITARQALLRLLITAHHLAFPWHMARGPAQCPRFLGWPETVCIGPATLCTEGLWLLVNNLLALKLSVNMNMKSVWGQNGGHILIICQWTVFMDMLSAYASADLSSKARARLFLLYLQIVFPRQEDVNASS